MRYPKKVCLGLVAGASLVTSANATQPKSLAGRSRDHYLGIGSFNTAFTNAVKTMNNEAVLSLWEENGEALLPNAAPIRGKSAIRSMMQSVSAAHRNARMESFTDECSDAEGSGRWASEWCVEHQIISEPGKPTFDSWGQMLLVLHQQPSGEWLLSREMWAPAAPPKGNSSSKDR